MRYYILFAVTGVCLSIGVAYSLFSASFLDISDGFDGIHSHSRGAFLSARQVLITGPCMIPVIAGLPWLCGRSSTPINEDRNDCKGFIEMLYDQHLYVRHLVYHTHPPDDFVTTWSSVTALLFDTDSQEMPWQGKGDSHQASQFGVMFDRCTNGLLDVVFHMHLSISRIEAIELATLYTLKRLSSLSEFIPLSTIVTLGKVMDILSSATLDSALHLSAALYDSTSLVADIRNQLEIWYEETRSFHDNSPSQVKAIDLYPRKMEGSATLFQAIRLLEDVESSLQFLREDVEALAQGQTRNFPLSSSSLTCSIGVAKILLDWDLTTIHKHSSSLHQQWLAAKELVTIIRR